VTTHRASGTKTLEAPWRIHAFLDSVQFARQVGRRTDTATQTIEVHQFPDRESLVRIRPPAGDTAVLVRSLHDPNRKIIEVLLAADALRRSGARRVMLLAPYLPYMRQDAVFTPGEPISQQVIGSVLGRAFDGVLTVEAHLHRIQRLDEALPCQARSLSAAPLLAAWIRRAGRGCLVVGPDMESESWVRDIAHRAETSWIVGKKERYGDHRVRIHFPPLPACSRAVIVDDIVSSGGTLAVAARTLRQQGVSTVDALIVHAVFAPGALARIQRAGVRKILSCDTIPHPTNAFRSASLLASALRELLP
jgi:ribose-phosphate pyrophosphokinase